MELSLCILFENRAVGELKNFFSQFRKACPKQKSIYFRISHSDLSLILRDQIEQSFVINNKRIVEQIKMNNPLSIDEQIFVFKLKDFDGVVQTVNQIVSNPKDLRLYLEQSDQEMYLTWSITRNDETTEIKQTQVEWIENLEVNLIQSEPMLMIPTWILNSMAQIAKQLDTSLKLNFYLLYSEYSVELEVISQTELPQHKSYFVAHKHRLQDLKEINVFIIFNLLSFFEINKHYILQFLDITSLEDNLVISMQDSPTHPLVLNYFQGEDIELGMVKQFVIPRMYQ